MTASNFGFASFLVNLNKCGKFIKVWVGALWVPVRAVRTYPPFLLCVFLRILRPHWFWNFVWLFCKLKKTVLFQIFVLLFLHKKNWGLIKCHWLTMHIAHLRILPEYLYLVKLLCFYYISYMLQRKGHGSWMRSATGILNSNNCVVFF